MLNFSKRLAVGTLMLTILIGCSTIPRSPSLASIPAVPVPNFEFGSCTSPIKTQAPCLDQPNAQRFIEYMHNVEVYTNMVEELRK